MLGLICKKIGMTQVFNGEGEMIPVTVLEVGPCTVVQRKVKGTDGYEALQLGFKVRKPKGMAKPLRGHFEKKKLPLFRHLKEFRTEKAAEFEVGQELFAAAFEAGERVNVTGVSKGRGFQGVIKRHGKHGGPASHGSNFRRRPGSIGMRTLPARVPKNMKLPGHMGDVQVTTKGLEVMEVRADDNLVLVKGAVPGATNGILFIAPAGDALDGREGLRRAEAKVEAKAEAKVEEKTPEKQEEKPKE
jgi:large subunit ribosomal protein L3